MGRANWWTTTGRAALAALEINQAQNAMELLRHSIAYAWDIAGPAPSAITKASACLEGGVVMVDGGALTLSERAVDDAIAELRRLG